AMGELLREMIGQGGDGERRVHADATGNGGAVDDEQTGVAEHLAVAVDHARLRRIAEAAAPEQVKAEALAHRDVAVERLGNTGEPAAHTIEIDVVLGPLNLELPIAVDGQAPFALVAADADDIRRAAGERLALKNGREIGDNAEARLHADELLDLVNPAVRERLD